MAHQYHCVFDEIFLYSILKVFCDHIIAWTRKNLYSSLTECFCDHIIAWTRKNLYSSLTECFCDYIISWMTKETLLYFLLPLYFFIDLYKNIFALLQEKAYPAAHEYKYHLYNEARSTKPSYSIIFPCSRSTCSTHSCLKSKQQCQSALGKNMSKNVLQRGVG